jgi:hypothetical protein
MVNVNTKDKSQTRVNIYPKFLSIQFSKNLFHRWDTALLYKNKQVNEYSNTARQFDVYLPSPLLFKTKEIRYNKDAHFEVSDIGDICFPKSEIGHSGVSIDFNDFTLDLDISRNPYQIDALSYERYGNYYYYGDDEYESTYSGGSSRGYGYQGKGDGRGSYGTNNPSSYGKKESALSKFVGVFTIGLFKFHAVRVQNIIGITMNFMPIENPTDCRRIFTAHLGDKTSSSSVKPNMGKSPFDAMSFKL